MMIIVKDEDRLSSSVSVNGDNRIMLIPSQHIIGNPIFRHFQQLLERTTFANLSIHEKTATITTFPVDTIKYALYTQSFQNLEKMWTDVFKDIPFTFSCIYEDGHIHNALIKPVYFIENAHFEFAPKKRVIVLIGDIVTSQNPNAYELRKNARKLIMIRERSEHEFDKLLGSYDNKDESEETNNG